MAQSDESPTPLAPLLVPEQRPDYVVAIGASAGGLEAIEQMLRAMPRNTGMAFVVLQHLSPDFKSQMFELMARWTTLDVHVAEHGMRLCADSIYLIPPGVLLSVANGCLLLEERGRGLSLPIDRFMQSCAADFGERSIAVILSGTGSDGSRGVRDIHDAGGFVIVQREDTAKFDGMPRSALETGIVDLTAAPTEMPDLLLRYTSGKSVDVEPTHSSEALKLGGMRAVFSLLHENYGIDFSSYKAGTVSRRIERRILLTHHGDLSDYIERLRNDRAELDALYRDLLIGVTAFFRDAAAFEVIEREVLPQLVANTTRGQELRIWVAGCATGEEAYSLGMLLTEAIESSDRSITAKIFATDVHRVSLEIAGAGVYPTSAAAGVGTDRLQRFFTPVEEGYRVSAELRRMIVFAPHNVIRDAPFTKIDLISCRNMLIYLQPAIQRKVLALFHFGLRTGGVLFMGPSETPGEFENEFEAIHNHWKIYRKRRDVRLLPTWSEPAGGPVLTTTSTPSHRGANRESRLIDVFGAMLDEALPPSVLIDSRHQIVHTFGDISALLRLPRGRPSLSLLDLLDGDLKLAIAGALHRAARVRSPVSFTDVRANAIDGSSSFEIRVRPVDVRGLNEPYYMVSLVRSDATDAVEIAEEPVNLDQASRDRLEALEIELRHTKENLQATIEELEASNEELQATNEELLASNEELQSTNEELHSVNEELYTVNAEFQHKIDQLTELTDDMDNLLLSTEVHTLFLDEHLAIRKFTPAMAEVFNLVDTDLGRRIDSFTYNIDFEGLVNVLTRTRDTGERFEAEVDTYSGLHCLLRVVPYRGRGRRSGVVVTLVDITRVQQAEQALRQQIDLRDRFLAMLSHELRNPLAAINNSLSLLERRGNRTDDSASNLLGLIGRQSTHMQRLLDDLLDVSRVTQGKIHLRREQVKLSSLLNDVLETLQHDIARRRLQLEVDIDESVWINGDAPRIVQIFDNLMTNAIKYTPPGGHIWLSSKQAGEEVVVRVRDDGSGIDEATRACIFDLFVQADTTLDRSQGGLGVGLTLVHQLVELHGGSIEVHSEGTGQGSEFVIRLPRIPEPELPASTPNTDYARPNGTPRVVVVEDRPEIRETLAELLIDSGYEVTTAATGHAGLEVSTTQNPHAVLLDIGLPGIDGFELARRLRANPATASVPLIAMTGYGHEGDLVKSAESGFDAHLIKPVHINEVLATLERLGVRSGETPN